MMKNAKRFLQITTMILFVASAAFAQIAIPQPQGLVNDFAGKLSPETRQTLENQLRDFNARHGVEIAVVTIPFDNLKNNSIENYTYELARIWRNNLGHPNLQMVLLVAIKDVKADGEYHGSTRLEVHPNLGKVVPDALAGEIIRGMREDFKAGQFDNALTKGVQSIFSAFSRPYGVLSPAGESQNSNPGAQNFSAWKEPSLLASMPIFFVIFFVFLAGFIVWAIARSNNGRQPNRNTSNVNSSAFNPNDSHYQASNSPSNWHDTTSHSHFIDSSSSSSYSDSGSSSSYSDSSSSSYSSDSSSSSSSDSSSSSSGGSTDNW
jgi:uncharacterized protein